MAEEEKKNDNNEDSGLMDKMLKTRTLTLFDQVNAKTAREVISGLFMLEAEDNAKPIYLYINSPGGEVNSGFAIYDVIRFIKPDVKIICSGLCASAANIILLAAKKENRLTLPNSRFLLHQPLLGGVSGPVSDIEITANEIVKTREKINQMIATETGQSLEKVIKDTDRDFWMNSLEAKDYGLITRIVSKKVEIE